MTYKITLKCSLKKDENKWGRTLYINSWESASATLKTLVKGALEELIDPYVIEYYEGDELRYRVEKT